MKKLLIAALLMIGCSHSAPPPTTTQTVKGTKLLPVVEVPAEDTWKTIALSNWSLDVPSDFSNPIFDTITNSSGDEIRTMATHSKDGLLEAGLRCSTTQLELDKYKQEVILRTMLAQNHILVSANGIVNGNPMGFLAFQNNGMSIMTFQTMVVKNGNAYDLFITVPNTEGVLQNKKQTIIRIIKSLHIN